MRVSFGLAKRIGLRPFPRSPAVLFAAALSGLFPLPVGASERLSRREAVAEALARNPAIEAAREQVAQARARVSEAKALPDPSFAATLEQEQGFLKPRTATAKDVGLGLTVPFPTKLRPGRPRGHGGLARGRVLPDAARQPDRRPDGAGLRRPARGRAPSPGSHRREDPRRGLPEEDGGALPGGHRRPARRDQGQGGSGPGRQRPDRERACDCHCAGDAQPAARPPTGGRARSGGRPLRRPAAAPGPRDARRARGVIPARDPERGGTAPGGSRRHAARAAVLAARPQPDAVAQLHHG